MQSVLSDTGKSVFMRNDRKESESFTDLPFLCAGCANMDMRQGIYL